MRIGASWKLGIILLLLALNMTACNKSNASANAEKAAPAASVAKDGIRRVSLIVFDIGSKKETDYIDKQLAEALQKLNGVQIVGNNNDADVLITVAPLVNNKINSALDISYISISYTILDFHTRKVIQNAAYWDIARLDEYIGEKIIGDFTKKF